MDLGQLAVGGFVKLEDHFPAVVPQCKEQAAKFFYCFTNAGQECRVVSIFLI